MDRMTLGCSLDVINLIIAGVPQSSAGVMIISNRRSRVPSCRSSRLADDFKCPFVSMHKPQMGYVEAVRAESDSKRGVHQPSE